MRNSLVVQWLRVLLSVQGTQVQSLVGELRSHMLQGSWAQTLQPESLHAALKRSLCAAQPPFFLKGGNRYIWVLISCSRWEMAQLLNISLRDYYILWKTITKTMWKHENYYESIKYILFIAIWIMCVYTYKQKRSDYNWLCSVFVNVEPDIMLLKFMCRAKA